MRLLVLFCLAAAPALAAGKSAPLRLVPVDGGGYAIERDVGAKWVEAKGIATVAELVPLLSAEAVKGEKIDYSNGVKFEGVYTILVGREDGTLGKYEGASDVIAFAAPETTAKTGAVTTLDGAIVFALKIDNKRAVQRFERGVITLTEMKKTL
ncbi:MAG: hypothetical protein HXY21_10435 [Parvularculaceae bacterium]|nr:hypothetical protein [Parvularculaceae bacterium]